MGGLRRDLRSAIAVLQRGGLVIFPTETVFGIGANARNDEACRCIYRIKRRPIQNPLIVHFYSLRSMRSMLDIPPVAEILFRNFAPGPLTLILPQRGTLSPIATAGSDAVAVRIPQHPVARSLLRRGRSPIAAPSANISGTISATRKEMLEELVQEAASHTIPLAILEGKIPSHGIESTIVDARIYPLRLLRPGVITAEEIRKRTKFEIHETMAHADYGVSSVMMPGDPMHPHYRPKAPLYLFRSINDLEKLDLSQSAILCMEHTFLIIKGKKRGYTRVFCTVKEYERHLYSTLHRMQDHVQIMAELPSDCSLALKDRLMRAAKGQCKELAVDK